MIAVLIAAAALAPPPQLTAVLERVRLAVPDARQIADLQICPPEHVSRDGQKFTLLLALSRPREARRYYLAVGRAGRLVRMDDLADTGEPEWGLRGDATGLNGIATRAMERRFEACRWVSAADLAAGWAALDRPN